MRGICFIITRQRLCPGQANADVGVSEPHRRTWGKLAAPQYAGRENSYSKSTNALLQGQKSLMETTLYCAGNHKATVFDVAKEKFQRRHVKGAQTKPTFPFQHTEARQRRCKNRGQARKPRSTLRIGQLCADTANWGTPGPPHIQSRARQCMALHSRRMCASLHLGRPAAPCWPPVDVRK